jgi:predicted lipid-binding transport protein (Tim44 family)
VCALLAVLVIVAPSGCMRTSRQTEVVPADKDASAAVEGTPTLTPLERGQVRHDILAVAEPAIQAFLDDDPEQIERYWDPVYCDLWAKYRKENAAAGETRVRKHERLTLDVTDMDAWGTEALVTYRFIDHSYTRDSDGDIVVPPTDKETQFQLTMVKDDEGKWMVKRLIAGSQHYK